MTARTLRRREIALVVGIGLVLRALVATLTPIPAEDGANYLWMAQRFAVGAVGDALTEVFPPLLPLLIAPLIALGIDPFRAGQVVTGLCGALALVPIMRATEQHAPGRGFAVGLVFVAAPLAVRFGAQCYTEPVFHLFGALALWATVRGRFVASGLAAGAAFWLRPEALAFAPAFVLADRRRGWIGVVLVAAAVVGLAAWRSAYGMPFELLPKLWFNAARGDGALTDDGVSVWRIGANLIALPGLWLEAFQLLGVVALYGLFVTRRRPEFRAHRVLLLVGLVAIALFLARRRFLVSWLFVLAPFVAATLDAMPERGRLPTVLVVLVTSLMASLKLEPTDRVGEREVGRYLATWLQPGERVAGDMTRVIWFAGCRPLPPKPFTAAELIENARAPDVRFVVLGAGRPNAAPVRDALAAEFDTFAMPETERRAAELRGMLVLERRKR